MIRSGLVSVTFRQLAPRQIVDLVARAGLDGIEWGGDIHVPHGDLRQAREVGKMTRNAGLTVASYGSYYRVGHEDPVPFEQVLATAEVLETTVIRVWAGQKGSAEADAEYRNRIAGESQRIADLAARSHMTVAYEFHGETLTDTCTSAELLLKQVDRPNLKTYWQPRIDLSPEDNLTDLQTLLPWLANVHVFWWTPDWQRCPLADGTAAWKRYIAKIPSLDQDRFLMIEFVPEDDPGNFLRDAATLKEWIPS